MARKRKKKNGKRKRNGKRLHKDINTESRFFDYGGRL